jgi:ribosomal protein S18 acetylase RimI-like enzyme
MPTGTTRLPEAFTIRDFRAGDETGVLAVLHDLQAHEYEIYDRSRPPADMGPWYIAELIQETGEGRGRILVAEGNGTILGYASLRTCLSSEGEKDEIPYTYAHVDDLAVLASARSKGVGAALLDSCEELARAAGQGWLRLGVLAANDRARTFYTRQGYGELSLTLEKKL